MEQLGQVQVNLTALDCDGGWKRDDPATFEKLKASLRRYGQLRPLVVGYLPDAGMAVLDGRRLAAAMRECGATTATAFNVGPVTADSATALMLALEIGFEVNYARLAFAVAGLLDAGATVGQLASVSPFDAERIKYFGVLTKFDWSQFKPVTTGQEAISWDAETPDAVAVAETEPVPVPFPAEKVAQADANEAVTVAVRDVAFDVDTDGQAALF